MNDSDSFTPGPWSVAPLGDRKYYGTIVHIGNEAVAVWTPTGEGPSVREIENGWKPGDGMDHVEDVTSYANARLIAAAPDLYEALEEVVAFWDSITMEDRVNDIHDKARAALEKARQGRCP